ncbi:MAG: helix-turn-helix domain-containing protein [Tannerella sp.]|jgi:excisionase family DNA binding protein|nr:helix-turn-helix domain-containing protein [Tannerella sp.]
MEEKKEILQSREYTPAAVGCRTFEEVPFALAYLITQVQELRQAVSQAVQNPATRKELDSWLNVEELQIYLPDHPAKPTIYGWVSQRIIPHHKGGKKLRFLQSEIDNWLSSSGKRKSQSEMEDEASEYLNKKKGGKRYE